MTGRPRTPGGEGADDGVPPGDRGRGESGVPPPRPKSVAQAEETLADLFSTGRPSSGARRQTDVGSRSSKPGTEDVELSTIMTRYDRLGDEPPKFNIARNDAEHGNDGAHTIYRHGPDIPLPRNPNVKTVEGRIYGDVGWDRAESWSYRWTDPSTMNRVVRDYVRENWDAIRSDLAMFESHDARFDAGHRVGEGYYNSGMYGAGPRDARYTETSYVVVRIKLMPGSDPPEPFIVTAFPAGLL